MKPIYKDVVAACMLGLVLPGILMSLAVRYSGYGLEKPEPTVTEVSRQRETVLIVSEEGPVKMDLEDYLTGVILAEMPVSFEQEAKKAQAVVARTYTIRAMEGKSKHDDGVVCTDSACCQGYISPEAYLESGGTQEGIESMRRAVRDTEGMVLTYMGELIEATYFSCSGGATEDAVAVWGTDVAYLRSVESPGEENAAHYSDTVIFSPEEFAKVLDLDVTDYDDPNSWLGDMTYTKGNGVNTMVICGRTFKGTELRKLLDLRSTSFTINADADKLIIVTRGYGHRVGMSQYGADAMAVQGNTFEQILAHYYQGTDLTKWSD